MERGNVSVSMPGPENFSDAAIVDALRSGQFSMAAIAAAIDRIEEMKWRPASEPPEESGNYIVALDLGAGVSVEIAGYSNGDWQAFFPHMAPALVAWKPLPKPPSKP